MGTGNYRKNLSRAALAFAFLVLAGCGLFSRAPILTAVTPVPELEEGRYVALVSLTPAQVNDLTPRQQAECTRPGYYTALPAEKEGDMPETEEMAYCTVAPDTGKPAEHYALRRTSATGFEIVSPQGGVSPMRFQRLRDNIYIGEIDNGAENEERYNIALFRTRGRFLEQYDLPCEEIAAIQPAVKKEGDSANCEVKALRPILADLNAYADKIESKSANPPSLFRLAQD